MPDTLAPPAAAPSTGASESTGTAPSSFQAPNPAFDRVVAAVKAKARPAPGQTPPKEEAKPKPAPKPKAEIPTEPETPETELEEGTATPPEPGEETTETPAAEPKADDKAAPADAAKGKKVSPWRLVDDWKKTAGDWKTKAETAERELAQIRSGAPAEAPKEMVERLKTTEAKLKEYEDHIRFLDYQKHPEFLDKYAKPYESAWKRATSELSEVAVTDQSTGAVRPATAEDMLALVNLPLGKAREYANQLFGDFADDAMAHRKEIKGLFDAQQGALKEARENGANRIKQHQEQTEAQRTQVAKVIAADWESANRAATTDPKHGKYFTPIEGDQAGNSALAKGFELADKAFGRNPNDPSLSPEERKEVIRMHSALRNRAAAFGRLRQWVEQRDARIAELEKELEDYKTTEPGTGGTPRKGTAPAAAPDPWDRIKEGIRKRANRA